MSAPSPSRCAPPREPASQRAALLLALILVCGANFSAPKAVFGALSPAIWAGTLWAVIVSAFVGWLVWGWVNAVRGVALAQFGRLRHSG